MSRAEDARRRAELADAAAAGEAVRAQALIDEFVADCLAHGPAPVELRAVSPRGAQVRTGRRGWYLRRNHTLAVDTDGRYLLLALTAEPTLTERFRGVTPTAERPSLVVGRGGRDGESGDLVDFLAAARNGL